MTGVRVSAAVALGAAVLAGAPQRPPYDLGATRSCLLALPNGVAGLPPARPPVPALLFVSALPHRQLGAWSGARAYTGLILRFFRSDAAARASAKSLTSLYGGTRVRNVVATWDQEPPAPGMRTLVLGCLRSGTGGPPHRRPAPRARLATFAGGWGGHTRGLSIGADGRGVEGVDDGCCRRVYRLTFRIFSVRGTVTHATAAYRVTSFRRYDRSVPALRVGDAGTLRLRNGIVTNMRTGVFYCSDPAWGATGACGA